MLKVSIRRLLNSRLFNSLLDDGFDQMYSFFDSSLSIHKISLVEGDDAQIIKSKCVIHNLILIIYLCKCCIAASLVHHRENKLQILLGFVIVS